MADTRLQRRLDAILAADVVGYSRLMGVDEAGTLAALRDVWTERFNPAVAAHRGRIVKMMGDGALFEFASAVDAVECATTIQKAMADHNRVRSGRGAIEFRIGVNLGDVVIDGDDIFGDAPTWRLASKVRPCPKTRQRFHAVPWLALRLHAPKGALRCSDRQPIDRCWHQTAVL
jgi:class 3 adenylate cyclase